MSIIRRIAIFAETEFAGKIDAAGNAHGINYDQEHGLGQVPHNQEVQNRGFAVMMLPSVFLKLADTLTDPKQKSLKHIKQHIDANKPIGSPFMDVLFNAKDKIPWITAHEGRHRMNSILTSKGDKPVLVHIFPVQQRAKHLTIQDIENFANKVRPQRTWAHGLRKTQPVDGPHFTQYYFNNEWHKL